MSAHSSRVNGSIYLLRGDSGIHVFTIVERDEEWFNTTVFTLDDGTSKHDRNTGYPDR